MGGQWVGIWVRGSTCGKEWRHLTGQWVGNVWAIGGQLGEGDQVWQRVATVDWAMGGQSLGDCVRGAKCGKGWQHLTGQWVGNGWAMGGQWVGNWVRGTKCGKGWQHLTGQWVGNCWATA